MLNKDPAKRITLLEVMASPYFIKDDDDLEDQVNKLTAAAAEMKLKEEEKAMEKQKEIDDIMNQHKNEMMTSSKNPKSYSPSKKNA